MTPDDLAALLGGYGERPYRARQILDWGYRGATTYEGMTDLPRSLRQKLTDTVPIFTATPAARKGSADGLTQKVLFRLEDGALVEAVHMRHSEPDGGLRTTVCVSSQAGCAYACAFCATGQGGYGRNLTPGEIVQQAVYFLSDPACGEGSEQNRLTNIVFMGMGEPFANYDAVRSAVLALNAPWGLGIGARRITVSTVGLVPEIRRFAREPWQAGLAISLHAPNDSLRGRLMPVNRKYPLARLMEACREYCAVTNRRVSFEYVLISGVNDEPGHSRELADLLSGLLCHVNLIPVNPTLRQNSGNALRQSTGNALRQSSGNAGAEFRRPEPRRVRAFAQYLERRQIPVTVRDTQGVDIQAGCGQLRVDDPQDDPLAKLGLKPTRGGGQRAAPPTRGPTTRPRMCLPAKL